MITLNDSDSIGNSLSSVNLNYFELENSVKSMQSDIKTYWTPMLNYYLDFNDFLKQTFTIAKAYSSLFLSTATTVQSNSAGWIKPITIFYPSLFYSNVSTDVILNTISTWISNYFPTTTISYDKATDTYSNGPSYVEGQKLIVYAHRWQYGSQVAENTKLVDYTTCYSPNKRICVSCRTYYYGHTYCGTNTLFVCTGQSVNCGDQCMDIMCGFSSPPYTKYLPSGNYTQQTQTVRWNTNNWETPPVAPDNYAYGYIQANVEMRFQDRNEMDNIVGIVFTIKNCSWVFNKFIST